MTKMENAKLLDSILIELDKENWYIDFDELCTRINVPTLNKNYVKSKLLENDYIEISSTKHSESIRITNKGRVFINESGFEKLIKNDSSNYIKVEGNENLIFQGINNSKISSKNKKIINKKENYFIASIGIIVAILTLFATLIIGWDNIIKFFTK